jgi:cardiolipin synthase (CMP-forming)
VTIPNFITLGRVFLVPVVFWLLVSGRVQAAFWAFIIAGISDGVDGYIAKRFNMVSELGSYLDPLADKLLVVSIFIAMGVLGELPSWLVIAVVSRDALIVMAIILIWLFSVPVKIRPFAISKANTCAQLVLASTVLADVGFQMGLGTLRWWLIWLTAFLTIGSLVAYMYAWVQLMAGAETATPGGTSSAGAASAGGASTSAGVSPGASCPPGAAEAPGPTRATTSRSADPGV